MVRKIMAMGWALTGLSLTGQASDIPAPIFVDPVYHGSCDPEIVWNPDTEEWLIFYTARRALHERTYVGTPLGLAASKDLKAWVFRGYLKFDGEGGQPDDTRTFWAPAIIRHGDRFHMFVTYKPESSTASDSGTWGGDGRIRHYAAPVDDPVNGWEFVADLHGPEIISLDATVYRDEDAWHVWFKGRTRDTRPRLHHLVSTDLMTWEKSDAPTGDVFNRDVTGYGFEEAPYVFQWQNTYWLITDPHQGLLVYSSPTATDWKLRGVILKEGGGRLLDGSMGRHCSVAVVDGRAFIAYHVEPWRDYSTGKSAIHQPEKNRRAVLQMAELRVVGGELVCDRNAPIFLP